VKLSQLSIISKVIAKNRDNCHTERLSNSEVWVLNSYRSIIAKGIIGNTTSIGNFTFDFGTIGTTVKIQSMGTEPNHKNNFLHLFKVLVLGQITFYGYEGYFDIQDLPAINMRQMSTSECQIKCFNRDHACFARWLLKKI